jgi:hypothetical protein
VARRQLDDLDASHDKEGIRENEQGVSPLARKTCESPIDLAAGAGVYDFDLQPDGASRYFHVLQRGLRVCCVGWIDEHG